MLKPEWGFTLYFSKTKLLAILHIMQVFQQHNFLQCKKVSSQKSMVKLVFDLSKVSIYAGSNFKYPAFTMDFERIQKSSLF